MPFGLLIAALAQVFPAPGSAEDVAEALVRVVARTESEGWGVCAAASDAIALRYRSAAIPVDPKLFPGFETARARIEAKLADKAILTASVDPAAFKFLSDKAVVTVLRGKGIERIALSNDSIPGFREYRPTTPTLVGYFRACAKWDGKTGNTGPRFKP